MDYRISAGNFPPVHFRTLPRSPIFPFNSFPFNSCRHGTTRGFLLAFLVAVLIPGRCLELFGVREIPSSGQGERHEDTRSGGEGIRRSQRG